MKKLLSIIIPMYNSKMYIEKCLDSLILEKAEMDMLEILVVDDGSTDSGAEIVSGYVRKYPDSIRLIHQENGGHGSAVNTGIRACTGTYFKILDADDWFLKEQLIAFLHNLQKIESVDFLVCGFQTYDIQTRKSEDIMAVMEQDIQYNSMEELVQSWNGSRVVFTLHGITYRTAFYRKYAKALPEKVYYDDAFYITVAASHAEKICMLNQMLYVYRIGDVNQSVSNANRVARIEQIKKVIRMICETERDERSEAGQKFWYYKTCSILADFYVTAFLRYEDKKAGRREAKALKKEIMREHPNIAKAMTLKYDFLFLMSLFHLNEKSFQKLLKIRSRLWMK